MTIRYPTDFVQEKLQVNAAYILEATSKKDIFTAFFQKALHERIHYSRFRFPTDISYIKPLRNPGYSHLWPKSPLREQWPPEQIFREQSFPQMYLIWRGFGEGEMVMPYTVWKLMKHRFWICMIPIRGFQQISHNYQRQFWKEFWWYFL